MNLRVAVVLATLVGTGIWVRTLPAASIAPALAAWWPFAGSTIVTLYFEDGGRRFPVSRRIPATDDVPRATLDALLAGPRSDSRLTSPIAAGVQIRSFSVAGDVARIDLSSSFAGEEADTSAAETAIVETMTAVPGVRSVALSVEGRTLAASATRTPLLYYASANGLVAVPAAARDARDAVTTYMAGPPDPALIGVPRDVQLLKYDYDASEGLVSLDFSYTASIRTLALEKPDIMRTVLLGLIASLTEYRDVKAVRIDFDGHTRLGLGECSDLLRTPQPRPRLLNDERLLGR